MWEHVSQLTALQQLAPCSWRSDISQQQWARLTHFKSLTQIKIWPHEQDGDAPLLSEHFLPPLLKCSSLQRLELGPGLRLNRQQLQGIAHRLPPLNQLELTGVWLEDISPLSAISCLTELGLRFCDGPRSADDPPLQFRTLLPPMRRLRSLALHDRCRITSEHAVPLNAEMLARMPALAMADLAQNPLPPAAVLSAASLGQSLPSIPLISLPLIDSPLTANLAC